MHNLRYVFLLEKPTSAPAEAGQADPPDPADPAPQRRCPHCETGHLTLLRRLSPARPQGP
jgi:hypothetical protein